MSHFTKADATPYCIPDSPARTDASRAKSPALVQLLCLLTATLFFLAVMQLDDADAKRKRKKRRVEPPLRILSITVSPETYMSGDGSLDITVQVAIPPGTDGSTLLEISSLISSPSKRHLRFLSTRKAVEALLEPQPDPATEQPDNQPEGTPANTPSIETPGPVFLTLTWDGTDQNSNVISPGRYDYVIRAKLLAMTEMGPRTHMVSWKKKGKLDIKPPPVEEPEHSDEEGQDAQKSEPE